MEKFIVWLDEQATRLREESLQMASDNRRDEGNLMKIRANVYGICKSVVQVLDYEAAKAKLTELSNIWNKNLSIARDHNNVEQAVIEEIKLETLNEIHSKLKEV